jgi:hypothetical protein
MLQPLGWLRSHMKNRDFFANYPAGNVFNCAGTPSTVAQSVQGSLASLGGSTNPTNVKSYLGQSRSNLYIMPNEASDQIWTNAGVTSPPFHDSVNNRDADGVTWSINGYWYSKVRIDAVGATDRVQPPQQPTFDLGAFTEIVAHELGHVVDGHETLPSAPPSTSAKFSLATQADLNDINYQPGSNNTLDRNPCAAAGTYGDPRTGPLVGALWDDGNPICNGTSLRSELSAYTRAGQILQSTLMTDGYYFFASGVGGAPLYGEWFAQAFAIQGWTDLSIMQHGGMQSVPAQVVKNGYFQCTASGSTSWLHFTYADPTQDASLLVPTTCH